MLCRLMEGKCNPQSYPAVKWLAWQNTPTSAVVRVLNNFLFEVLLYKLKSTPDTYQGQKFMARLIIEPRGNLLILLC